MSKRLIFVVLAGLSLAAAGVSLVAQTPAAPRYKFDPDWPRTMPNKWKIGGVTGLAVAPNDDTVWVYDRPNDLTNLELESDVPAPDRCGTQGFRGTDHVRDALLRLFEAGPQGPA